MDISWETVDSSAIAAMAYEDDTMYVRYKDGNEYAYEVSYDEYLSIKEAPSIGRALRTVSTRGRRV